MMQRVIRYLNLIGADINRGGLAMKKGMVLRIISLVMFVVAIIFIACALAIRHWVEHSISEILR